MDLSDRHLKTLIRIYDAKEESLSSYQVSNDTNLLESIIELIKLDLIEYVEKEDRYYLLYKGYEIVEESRNPTKKKNTQSEIDQYHEIVDYVGGSKKLQGITLIALFIFGLLGTIYLFQNQKEIRSNSQTPNINQETLDSIQYQINSLADSIRESRKFQQH